MAILFRRSHCHRVVVVVFLLTMATAIGYYNSIDPVHLVENLVRYLTTEELFDYSNLQDDLWILRTPVCSIQRQDPWDPLTRHYFRKLPSHSCPKSRSDMLVTLADDGYLTVDMKSRNSLLGFINENEVEDTDDEFVCRMWKITRNWIEEDDRTYRISKEFTEFKDRTLMDTEYAKVQCYTRGRSIYHNYFFRIVRKPEVEEKCQMNEQLFRINNSQCNDVEPMSVLVIGVDSVSKSNFIRQFPDTFDLLVNNLMALDFHGYNKVGLNTFPCLIPYLSGKSTDELKQTCWGGGMNTFDNCTLMWDMFENAGYRTAFVENLDEYGLFLHNKAGRRRQMAHYYGHTLYMPLAKYLPSYQKGCWRGKSDDEMVLEWAYQFQKEFNATPHFGHFWLSKFSHEDINSAQFVDSALLDVVTRMHTQGLLSKTLLIIMSDHGIRYGAYRETEPGRLEENLPFLFMIFPQWFQNRFPQSMDRLRRNRFRLMTTFDLHETLKSVINCDYKQTSVHADGWQGRRRGVSLFSSILPNRTCDDAGIPNIFCACKQNVVKVDTAAPIVSKLANRLVIQLNGLTAPQRSLCAVMSLNTVIFVKQVTNSVTPKSVTKQMFSTQGTTYIVAIVTSPGNAKFEATVLHLHSNDTMVVNNDIRRINRYGDTSRCIKIDGFMKSLCYCM